MGLKHAGFNSQNDSGVGDLASDPLREDVWRKGHFSLGSTKNNSSFLTCRSLSCSTTTTCVTYDSGFDLLEHYQLKDEAIEHVNRDSTLICAPVDPLSQDDMVNLQ
jgi:hypothetical protein